VRRSKQNAQAKTYGIIMAVGHTGQPLGFLGKRECQEEVWRQNEPIHWTCHLGLNGKGPGSSWSLTTDEVKLRPW
jgi:hypothetical protein